MENESLSPFRNNVLQGKVAFLTGGATGIGFGIALAFGQHGAKIAITGRRVHVLQNAVTKLQKQGIEAIYFQSDVRDYKSIKEAIDQTVKHYNRLDILVNSAAGNFLAAAKNLSSNGFKTVVDIDLNGTFNTSLAAFEALRTTGNGLIINITATLGYTATHWQIHASAAKCGIDAITRNLGVEWGPHGIRCVGIAPGPIANTEGMNRLSGTMLSSQQKNEKQSKLDTSMKIPVGRLGHVEDIACMAVFLATDAAGFITGETIVVDGGSWLYKEPFVSEDKLAMITELLKQKNSSKKSAL